MTDPAFPLFGDVAHLGHVELFTPKPDESLAFFTSIVGLHESGRTGDSVYLRGWGDYEWHTLKLTAHTTSGIGHLGLRVRDEPRSDASSSGSRRISLPGQWMEISRTGRRTAARRPTGTPWSCTGRRGGSRRHPTSRPPSRTSRSATSHAASRRAGSTTSTVLARHVSATRRFFHELLGLRLQTEQLVFDDGTEMGAWLSATNKSYDVATTRYYSGASGRLHHLTYMMDSREDVLRAADILRDADVPIETGPHKHSIGQTFFLYRYEPGGNRFEIGAGGYLILDSDWKPVVWTQAERAKGQWGPQTVSTSHTHGTPPVPEAEPSSR